MVVHYSNTGPGSAIFREIERRQKKAPVSVLARIRGPSKLRADTDWNIGKQQFNFTPAWGGGCVAAPS